MGADSSGIQVHYIYCELYFYYYYHQLHLRSSGIRSRGLGPLGLTYSKICMCLYIWVFFFSCFYLLSKDIEKAMAPHSSSLVWKIPWVEEPGGLWYMGLERVGHD